MKMPPAHFFAFIAAAAAALGLSAAPSVPASGATIPGSFKQLDCEGGGWFEQVIPHSSGRLYGRTDIGGMYRSDDHGDTWTFLSGDLPYAACYYVQGVAVAAGNANVVYQATGVSYAATDPGRGIWKSTNGGSSWTQVLAGVNFSGNDEPRWGSECLVIQPGNDSEIWAGTRGDGLRRSTDAGANWTNVSPAVFDTPNVVISGITIHPSAPDTIWVCGDGGLWVSTNHGASWTQKLFVARIYRLAVKADGTAFAAGFTSGGSNVLYRFTSATDNNPADLYANFLNASLPYPPYQGDQLATVQVLANGDVWAATLFEFLAKSSNNGNSFTYVPGTLAAGPLPGWARPGSTTIEGGRNGLIQDPTNANRLFLGGGYSPFRSTDGGATWSFMNNGIGETVAWRANFHPTDPNRVWFPLADLGATTASDAGASGATTGYIAPKFPYPDDNVMFTHRLLVSANKVIAPGGEQSNHQPRIYQTTDNGATWTKLAGNGLPFSYGREILETVASSDNADDFLVFTGGAIDATSGGVYRTTNGGANFTRATGLPNPYDPGAEFYWNVSLERDASAVGTRYLLLRNSGFWKSTDRGASWTKPAVQPNATFGRLRVDPATSRIWVGTVVGLEYSPDGGASWTFLNNVFTGGVTELDACGGRLAVIGRMTGDVADHIYYSGDNGATWNEITRAGNRFAKTEAVAVDPWRPGTVWISTGGRAIARFTPWTAVEIWRNDNFGSPLPTGSAAPLADPDNDGLVNAFEYVFSTNPQTLNGARPWQVSSMSNRLTLTFPRNTSATDATITVQGTDSLTGAWTDLARSTSGAAMAALVGGVTVTETGTGATRSVEVRDLYTLSDPAHPQRFLRLKVVLP